MQVKVIAKNWNKQNVDGHKNITNVGWQGFVVRICHHIISFCHLSSAKIVNYIHVSKIHLPTLCQPVGDVED